MDILLKNLRQASRSLRKHPAFTVVALLTLALGIGANTAIFSVLRAVVLAPLPYPEAGRLVQIWPERPVSVEQAVAFEEENATFSAVSAYQADTLPLVGAGRPEQLIGGRVSTTHFEVLAVEPARGRAFTATERHPGSDGVVMLSHHLWQQRFGGEPEILGRELQIDGRKRTVIGVMPEDFRPVIPLADVWIPLAVDPASEEYRDWLSYDLIARLTPGTTIERAQEDVRRIIQLLHERDPEYMAADAHQTATVGALLDQIVGESRATLWLLFAAVALVLLIACVNVANLVLARGQRRLRELAVRAALGAARRRLVGLLLCESLLLALLGGGLGVIAAAWAVSLLTGPLSASLPRTGEIAIDGSVLVFALGASLFAGLLFGLVPALRATGFDVQSTLKSGGRGSTPRHRLHHALVTLEIAVSLVLVIGAGLLVKSFWQLQRVDAGFATGRLLTFRVQPDAARYPDDATRCVFYEDVAERLAGLPGVESAGGINRIPLTPGDVRILFMAKDVPVAAGERPLWTSVRMVTPELIETLGIPLLRGRQLTDGDREGAQLVGLVNQTLARQIWGDEDPVGKELLYDDGSSFFTVVGLVGDIRQHRLDAATVPQVYVPIGQNSWASQLSYALRTASDPLELMPQVERAVWSVDPNAPITQVRTMEEVVRRSFSDKSQTAGLFSLFAALALVLGAIGVYGVTAYLVSQHTHEIGVRIALGATGGAVVRHHLARVMAPVAAGIGLGLAASWAATRVLSGLLYEVEATDPSVFAMVVVCLALCAALAGYLPARRAARVDPMVILGTD